jgi:hypothetical protein
VTLPRNQRHQRDRRTSRLDLQAADQPADMGVGGDIRDRDRFAGVEGIDDSDQ